MEVFNAKKDKFQLWIFQSMKKNEERGISSTTHKQKCILTPTQSFVFGMSLITLGSRFSNALPT